MIILDQTTETLEVVLTAAKTTNDMDVYVAFVDISKQKIESPGETPGGNNQTVTNGTTTVTACVAPSQSSVRNVHYISVHNKDTAAKVVVVKLDKSATEYILASKSIAAGETLVYNTGAGWFVI